MNAMVGQDESLSEMVRKLRRCDLGCGSGKKRFVGQLALMVDANRPLETTLTDAQKDYLRLLRHMYREQITRLSNIGLDGKNL